MFFLEKFTDDETGDILFKLHLELYEYEHKELIAEIWKQIVQIGDTLRGRTVFLDKTFDNKVAMELGWAMNKEYACRIYVWKEDKDSFVLVF